MVNLYHVTSQYLHDNYTTILYSVFLQNRFSIIQDLRLEISLMVSHP